MLPRPVARSGALLNGTANPLGANGDYGFEWGTDPTLTKSPSFSCQILTNPTQACNSWTANSQAQSFNWPLNGLPNVTTYYFRFIGYDADNGTYQYGAILSFTAGTPPPAASASYIGVNSTTQGTWTGDYGADGNLIANETAAPPPYATVSLNGDSSYTWATSTTDPRALQTTSGATTRIASTFYSSSSFTINVNLTDGNTHRIALYLLDWDSTTRSETISILDANTNAVLDTETYSSFHNGAYASWNVQGDILIKITKTGGSNAVVSGIFFDPQSNPGSATYVHTDTTTQGTWTGVYGSTGDIIANDANNTPTFATVAVTADSVYTWAASTTDVRALQTASGASTRIASTYYSSSTFTINVNLTDGNTHKISLYLLDWDSTSRTETIKILDANTNTILDTETYSEFHNGEYAAWNVKGHVLIQVTKTGGSNAVVSGIFFD